MDDKKLFNDLEQFIFDIEVFDTHEHLMSEKERKTMDLDVFDLFSHYVGSDIISAGMKKENFDSLFDRSIDIEKRWALLWPYLENVKNTSYYKTVLESVKGLFEIDKISEDTYVNISEKMKLSQKSDWYEYVLCKKSKIFKILNIIENIPEVKDGRPVEMEQFIPVKNLENIILACCIQDIEKISKKYDMGIYSLKDYIRLIDKIFEEDSKKGYKVLKILSAYFRTISFEEVAFSEADKIFSKIFTLKDYGFLPNVDFLSKDELKPLQDYLTHYAIQKAIEYGWPVQIHSGLLNGNRGDITNTNPCLLINLFLKYRNCKFDIFHAGYPFSDELMVLSKQFTNVYFDLCWIHQVSFSLYSSVIDRAIEMIPSNKIFAFGGDNTVVEIAYGSIISAKKAITRLLYDKINNKYFTFEEAVEFAEKILYLNPKDVYCNY